MNEKRFAFALAAGISFGSFAFPLTAGPAQSAPQAAPPAAPAPAPRGAGGLLVAPTRVTFDSHNRTASLTLINTGNVAATYRISFVQMKMEEDGSIRELPAEEAALNPADTLVRFSPRQVYLEPNVAQAVRLQLRKPENLKAGEYRSHLLFRVLPSADPAPEAAPEGVGLSVRLDVIYGVSIPVIVRHGELWSKVAVKPLALVPPLPGEKDPGLMVRMDRSGNESAYGDLTATLLERSGREVPLGVMNGLAVYSPNPVRNVRMSLRPPPGVELKGGRIRVAYAKPRQKDQLLASGYLPVP